MMQTPPSFQQTFSWWSFARGVSDPNALLRSAAEIGYAAVDMPPEEIWPMVRDSGLKISAISGHGTLKDGLNRRENHDRIAAEIEASLAKVAAWDVPNLIVFSGNRNGMSDSEGAEITAEGLSRIAPLAEQAGITLIMELLNSLVDHADYQADHTDWGVEVCRMVDSPRVKLLYDIYHMQVMEGNVIANIRQHGAQHFAHYHTAGVPGRRDLDDDQELQYQAIARAIAATGFTGFLGHEFMPKGDPAAALKEAFLICDV